MNSEERLGGASEHGSEWGTLTEYGEQHPFETRIEVEPKPSGRERRAEQKMLKLVTKEHPEIYSDSDELAEANTKQVLDKIRENRGAIVELGKGLESREDLPAGIERAVRYFCQEYGLRVPTLDIYEDKKEKVRSACYEEKTDVLSANVSCMSSPAEAIGMVAHELWHKHQYETGGEAYEINFRYYHLPENYNAFRSQLIENEAFMVEDEVADICRRAYVEEHPEMKRGIWTERRLKDAWLDRRYLEIAREKPGRK